MTVRIRHFVQALASAEFPDTFNPYSDRCGMYDCSQAPAMRRRNLGSTLRAAQESAPNTMWIGRDLGFRGGRRTGLALTDDVHLPLHGDMWGIDYERPTRGAMMAERTASSVWSLLTRIGVPVFLWNVFPWHPHMHEEPFSNRAHRSAEGKIGEDFLCELIRMLEPRRLVAIGNDAARSARRLGSGAEIIQVRHPAYGGQRQFRSQICRLYALSER